MADTLLYDYFGLEILLSEDAQIPIQILGKRGLQKDHVVLRFENGLLQDPVLIESTNPLDADDKEIFLAIIEQNSSELLKKWFDKFIYNKEVEAELLKEKIQKKSNS